MKVLLTAALVQFLSLYAIAQTPITNTKWKGHIEIPQGLDIVLEFKNDSLIATSAEGMELEVMFFLQVKDTLKLRKLKGQSPCDFTTEGFYHVELAENGDKLLLHLVKDDCTDRAKSITSTVAYLRIRN